MGIIADTMAEVVERTKGTMEGAITDLRKANTIELVTATDGKVWVNVDGMCALRINMCESVYADVSGAKRVDKLITK